MTASNIERFDEITGQLLGALYEKFPMPRNLFINDFVADGYSYSETTCADVPNANGQFFFACIDWLSEAGYLRFKERNHYHGYIDAVLTAQGLAVLKVIPQSLQSGPSLGEQLVDASKGGAKEVVRGLVGETLSLGARIISTHLGLPG